MDNNLEIMVKNVYGNDLIYPQCEQAKKLANFKGTKTFTDLDLKRLDAMGYEFTWLADRPALSWPADSDRIIQQRIYILESMVRQGEATHKEAEELLAIQKRNKAKERFLKISYEDA